MPFFGCTNVFVSFWSISLPLFFGLGIPNIYPGPLLKKTRLFHYFNINSQFLYHEKNQHTENSFPSYQTKNIWRQQYGSNIPGTQKLTPDGRSLARTHWPGDAPDRRSSGIHSSAPPCKAKAQQAAFREGWKGFLCVWVGFCMVPQTVCPHYGVLTVSERSGVLEVSFRNRGFRLRRHAQSSVCVDSVARNGSRGILGRFTGCPCTFWSKT